MLKAMTGWCVRCAFQPPRAGFRQRCRSFSKDGSNFSCLCRCVSSELYIGQAPTDPTQFQVRDLVEPELVRLPTEACF